jgi:glycerol-3-phosphate acyltransferase PlsY
MIAVSGKIVVLIVAYLLGSIPTALIIARRIKGVDIRTLGDGNMGARNTFHEIGSKFGVIVAIIDFSKGALAVFLTYILGFGIGWQILTGISTILGHDFPVFAKFRGGQGTAVSFGTMLILFPLPTLVGLVVFTTVYLFIKRFSISCGIGGATTAIILLFSSEWILLIYAVAAFLFIPVKLFIDSPRRESIQIAGRNRE